MQPWSHFSFWTFSSPPNDPLCPRCSPSGSHSQAQIATNLLLVFVNVPSHITTTTHCVALCPWLFSLRITFLRLIHARACIVSPFIFVDKSYSLMWIDRSLVPDHHVMDTGDLQFLAWMGNAALNILIQLLDRHVFVSFENQLSYLGDTTLKFFLNLNFIAILVAHARIPVEKKSGPFQESRRSSLLASPPPPPPPRSP